MEVPKLEVEHALHPSPPTGFLWKYIFSTDHKVIGKQYFFLSLAAAVVGVALSLVFRLHLSTWTAPNPMLSPETYLSFVTMHGTLLVFMVLTTAPLSGFGNYFLPLQIGADDMAFPRLNMLSFWGTFLSFLIFLAAFFVPGGAPISGWTGYPPLSGIFSVTAGMGWGQTLWILGIAVFCVASMLGAINFIVTTLDLRTRGMSLMRMPLTVWGWLMAAIVALLTFAVLLAAGILLLLDRHLGTSFYMPEGILFSGAVLNHKGGSPLLFQHLFWFFGHPEVYIIILPNMGIISHILSAFSRRPVFAYRVMVGSLVAIAILGLFVWGHHMFQSGMSPYTAIAFSVLTMVITVPSALKTINWLATLWKGNIRFTAAMYWALGFVSLFVSGGVSGIMLGQNTVDIYFHDTYFVVAHFHVIMGVAATFATVAATYYWFPKMFGRHLNETLGKIHFWGTFAGVYLTFIPMHLLGMWGHPRRYAGLNLEFLQEPFVASHHHWITYAAFFTALVQFVFLFNLCWSLLRGQPAEANPWQCTTLEWSVPSPPPWDNFAGRPPEVCRGPYEYGALRNGRDFLSQAESSM